MMGGPLSGYRVVEIGSHLAVSLMGRLLADQGAEVTRLCFHASDETGSLLLGRDKRVVDLSVSGKTSVAGEILQADLVAYTESETFRKLAGDEAVRRGAPRGQVRVVFPAFPTGDPEAPQGPNAAQVADAACGLYTDVNVLRGFLGLDPVYSALPHAAVYAAVHGATAATLALLKREIDGGLGIDIEVPLAAAGISAMASSIMRVPNQPARYDIPRVPRLLRRAMPSIRTAMSRAPRPLQECVARLARRMIPPLMDSFVCADRRHLYLFAVDHDRIARTLLVELGLLDEVLGAGLTDVDAYKPAPLGANLREGANLSDSWRRHIRRRIAEVLRRRDAHAWERDLVAAGLPCTVVRSTEEWLHLTELVAMGIVETRPGPRGESIHVPGPHVWVTEGQTAGPARPPSMRGIGLLSGLRVVDFSSMVAAPVAARTLGDYGAEVIKVVAPHPRHGPRMVCWYGIDVDQGKRAVILDLKTALGQEALHRLLKTADVVVHNFTERAARHVGLSPGDIAARRPDAVLCRIGAYRGPKPGPWSERRGYDPVLQAAAGIMERYGDPGRPEHHGIASCVDYLTGFSGALAVALGLLARQRDGEARLRIVDTSLAQSAMLIQAPVLFDLAPQDVPRGQLATGVHALRRLYRVRGGWIFLTAPETQLAEVAARIGVRLAVGAEARDPDVARTFERALRTKRVAAWLEVFADGLATIWPVESFDDRRERWLSGLRPGDAIPAAGPVANVVRGPHPAGGVVDTLAPGYARIAAFPLRVPAPAPRPGADTRAVLIELGFDELTVDRMIADGVAAERLAPTYLPP